MAIRLTAATLGLFFLTGTAAAADEGPPIDLPYWSVIPFVVLLLCIAILPILAEHWWHKNRNKAIVSLGLGLAVAGYLYSLNAATNGRSVAELMHSLQEFASFMIFLGSLYVIAGGIVIHGDIQGKPLTNTLFLALGAILANIIGTTGASMLLIRPVSRINQERRRVGHIPVFFIFTVSNLGGLLTPLGDPPLLLGFLRGVDFFWTLRLWKEFLLANGLVLALFLVWDCFAYRRESRRDIERDVQCIEPIRVTGLINLLFLAGVVGSVLLKARVDDAGPLLKYLPEGLILLMAVASLALMLRGLRQHNRFGWGPIIEVAVLFIGIFITMVPALQLLAVHGRELKANGLTEPWQYFWLTGLLSAFLDNAPTYLTFATLAAGTTDLKSLMEHQPRILEAISCGAVFMGALTYIGNGPNFMVKAIVDQSGLRMPSFFGYTLYSGLILIPIFVAITFVVFLE